MDETRNIMKVAFLSHFYPPTHNAGIEQNTHSIARGLLNLGHKVRVLCCGRWTEGEKYFEGTTRDEWEGVPVERLLVNWTKAPQPLAYLYYNPVLIEYVRRFLKDFQPDVVHISSMYTLSASAIEAAKDLGLPVVLTLSDFWSICPRHTLLRYDGSICNGQVSEQTCQDCLMNDSSPYRKLRRLLPQAILTPLLDQLVRQHDLASKIPGVRGLGMDIADRRRKLLNLLSQVDHFFAPSEYVRRTIQQAGLPIEIQVSPYGNDLSWLSQYQPRQDDGVVHIGYIGQITPIKGVDRLIEAFLAQSFGERARLLIYGKLDENSPFGRQLSRIIHQHSNIEFKGPYLHSELAQVLSTLDLIVVPSVWPEVYGLVVQEAFAARIPVIASRAGGLPESVQEGRGGLTFDPAETDGLRRLLRQVVDGGRAYLDSLRQQIPPVRTSEDEVNDLLQVYRYLVSKYQLSR